MSLKILSKQQIYDAHLYRWPRICIHPEIWNIPCKISDNPLTKWEEIKFEKKNIHKLNDVDGKQGIYMFVVKPNTQRTVHHSYILYIGEASNLKNRFSQYFRYATTSNPSDQLKRRMVIVWENYLYFYYFVTNFSSTKEREVQEYDLIDTIVPPMNDKFRSKALKAHLKSLKLV